MPVEIRVIPDLVFPETPLPDALFSFGNFACGARGRGAKAGRKKPFDGAPAPAEIRFATRQGPDRVQMVRQDTHGKGLERISGLRDAPGIAVAARCVPPTTDSRGPPR